MDLLSLMSRPTGRQGIHPLLQILWAVPHECTDSDESRAALQKTPSSEGGEAHTDLFGHIFFC